jgi:uncharacterized repeat protein (TIGR01451 family)
MPTPIPYLTPRLNSTLRPILGIALLGFMAVHPLFAAKVKYTYDSAGRLVAEDYGGGKVARYIYDPNGNLLTNATVLATNADVSVTKSAVPASGAAGANFTYTIIAANAGPDPAPAVVVTDTLPFGVVPLSFTLSQGFCAVAGRVVTCNFGLLPAGASATNTLTAYHGFDGSFTNVATATAGITDPDPTNNTASFVTTATAPPDSDFDGMPNWWETLHGLSPNSGFGANGPDGDPDLDGVRNFDEWGADTDPLDANSFFHISAVGHAGNMTVLEFQSSSIRRYHAQFTPLLIVQPLTNFLSFNGTGGLISILHTNGSGGFYQLQAEVP